MTSPALAARPPRLWKAPFVFALAMNALWINASEVFRYFAFIMPMTRDALPLLGDVAPMDLRVFLVWGVWDTILVASATMIAWLALDRFGATVRTAVLAGTGIWFTVFVLFWLATLNMNLTTPKIVLMALPLAWVEMVVAALIVRWACFLTTGPDT